MEHEGSFDVWWSAQEDKYLALNITKQVFERFPFKNGFNKGDIMVIVGTDPEDIEVGDVIVFEANKPYPIIHRVVHVWREDGKLYFRTKGDNNDRSIVAPDLNELQIDPAYYLGRAVFRIPYVGYVKIVFVDMLRAISGGLSVAR
ncbi:signal peptidase I [Candidatus Woesearchaeota archaeon]|nr:MAG: signal peptidase I [Candidatus Woesearchaeota archaeon]